jgi:hypothetical protein
MQELIIELGRLREDLNGSIESLRKAGYEKAKTEYIYRVALAKELLTNRDKGLPVTLNNDVSKGNEAIAKSKFERDVAETNYEAVYERLRAIKIELGIIERQIEAIRRGD